MVAVVAGQGLGLYNNSLTGLNGQSSALGQGNNRVFINHNTGNLIIQHYTDELASKGLNTSLLQTYNSQGQSNDPRNQPWLLGLNRYISELPEVPNEAGSLLVKRNGDGSESIYRYSEQHKAYITADGDGAHDVFRYDAATKSWTWEEGSSRVKEFYNGTGQLTALEDKAGNRTQLTYHNNQLTKLEDASGQITHLSYEGQKLTAIQIEYTGDNSQQIKRTLARYGYDDLGRLETVITDLTPDDNSVEDGAIYQTTYSYEGDSQRIKQITNSDGTQLTFTYQQVGDKYVISQYRDATGIGADYHYDADNRTTQVTDALGQQTDYQFDDLGRIVKVLTPAIDGQRTSLQYSYDAQDNIVEVIDGLGNKVTREFDVMGNLVYEFDANHHIKHFQYNDQQQLVAEATWQLERAPLNDNERKAIPENVVAKRYVYDEQGFKRFVISPEGNITGLNYDAYGQLVETYQTNGILYPKNKLVLRQGENAAQPTVTELNALVSSEQAEKVMQTTSLYDSRGLVGKVIQHDGQGNTQETAFQYDAFGRLLRKIDGAGVAETINYDGLGRVLSKTNKAGQTTVFRYDDQQHTVATTFSNGLVKTELFDAAGRLLSRTEKATDTTATNRVRFFYDKAGRQVASEDKTGSRSYTLFDARNRKVASIDSVGALTEFRYDANGQLIESIQYQTLVDTRRLLSFGQLNESLFNIDKLRPKANPTADRHQYWVYNSQGQKRFQVDGAGAVTEWAYNAYGKVVSEKRYETALNSDVLAEPLTEANILAKLGDYTPIVVDNSTTTRWPASEHSDAQYHLGALTQTTKTVTSGANIEATSQASTRNAKPWPDYVTEIKQQNHPDINGTILLNYLTPEERAQVKYIRADLYNLQTRHSTLSRTFPDKFDDYQGQLVLPAISGNGRFRATVIVELNDGTTIVKPTFVLEKGRQQVLSQTLRWPADDMAELSGAEHTLKYRIVDRVGPDLESGTPFTEKSIAVVDGFYQVELTDLIPNTSYEIVIDQQAGGQRTGDVSRYHKTARFQWVPQTSHQPLNVRWEQHIIANKPTAGASLTGVITDDEAHNIDYIQVYVDDAQTNEQVSEAITYPRGYRFYQGNINLSLDRPLDSGNYRISIHKHYLDGSKQSESFMYTVGDQQGIVVNSKLTIPLDKLPLDVTQPGTTIAYRLAQQDNAEYQFIDLASQRSADGKSIELKLHDLVASRNDLYIKIVKDGYPPIELEGHALVVVDGYSYQTPLLKFADPNGDHIKGRFSHQLYNDNQQLIGSLDAAGYLTEYVYNPAGQKIREIRYAQKAVDYVSQQFDRELADIRPTADVADQQTHFIYDGFGQLTATVNAEGYLSENVYNALGQLTQTICYHQSVNYAGQSLTELRTLATHANQPNSVESITYDTAGRKQTSTDRFGVVTRYTYNADGLLSQTLTGEDKPFSQAQITQRRFDQKGRIIAELTPEGAKRLAEATTDTAREAVWRDHATTFIYNEAGLKIRQQAPKTTEGGQPVTFFYYDHQQRLRYSIQQVDNRGQASVIEYRYNSFGEQTTRVDYFTLIDSKELTGGLDNSRQLKVIKSNPKDRITQQDFDQAGRKRHTIAADGAETRLTYNSFGEVSRLAKSIRAANGEYAVTETAYDQRGLVSRISQLVGSAEVSTTLAAGTKTLDTHHQYDAFGRLTVKTFADNHRQQTAYDRLNRVIAEINHSGETTAYRYDALGRKVSVTDPLGQVTQYQFDDQSRTVTLVSPAGHTVKTQHNQHGETLEITDAKGHRQRFTYDEAGRQINAERLDAQGNLLQQESKVYNQRGWLVESIDSQGIKRQFSYDAAGRKLSETVDPEGAKLTTSFRLDAFGQVTYQRGPDRVSTTMQYDAAGRVLEVMRDSGFGGASLITRSTYNELGQLIAVEKGDRRHGMLAQTHYHYDALGRKVAEVVDPDGLALTTRYQYDARGNVLVKTDANGSQSFFGYDVNNRLRYSVDGQGGVTAYKYDAAGQKILTRHYAKAINVEGLAEQLLASTESRGDIEARLAARSLPQLTEHDRLSFSFFNADGQVTHKVNGLGQVTALHYDANGNVIQESRYSNPLADTQVYALLENHDLSIVAAGLKDNPAVTTYQFYNALNQPEVVIDAAGYVAVNQYDEVGRLTSTLKYSLHYDDHLNIDPQKMHQLMAADVLQSIEKVKANPEEARALTGQRTQIIYDELGRKQYQIDAAGYISAFKYDVNDRLVASLQYKAPINISLDSVTPNVEQLEAHIAQHNETAVFQQHVYDKVGREVYTIDGQGYVTEKVYDALGQVTGTKRYTMPVEYNAAPSYSSVRRAVRRLDAVATHTAYDNAGRVQLEIDALGHVTGHEYDALGQLRRTVRYAQALDEGLRGGSTSEIAARLSGLSHAQDQATVYRYDAAGHKTALITGAASAVTLGLSEDQRQAGLASGQLRAEFYEYDALGQRTALRQATTEGDFRTLFYYDSKGQLTRELKQVDAEQGYLTVFDYDAFGNKIFENRYSGLLPMALGANQSRSLVYADRIVRFRYDALNRLVAETVPSADGNGHETQYQYDAFGNLTLKTEAAGMQAERRTAYRYDERNQKIAEITALGTEAAAETQYRYDALGRVSAIVDARGVALVQDDSDWALAERARLGIVNTVTTADGQTRPGGAKRAHELTEEDIATLQAAYTSEQTFDAAGRKIAERDPLGHETHTVYDAFGNIIKATDPRGQVGYFFYDANNRLRLQIDPKGYATETRYDAFGQVVSTYQYQQALDLSGGTITEQSDLTALISQLQAPVSGGSGSASDKVIVQQHTLNAFGQILSTTQAGVTTTFSYDALGNKISATDGNGHTTHYAYDAQGRLIEETSPEVRVVTDVEQGVVSTQVVVTRHQYDQLGNKTQTIVGANSDQPRVTEFRYNAQGQLIQQR
ncbi:RHS repeat protein, partial [Zooshikella ganghwensis]|uniref:RHS repeat protein n=2 Tax=Zooshikella ganghwensis TaxID=202772 RepID=UPI001BAF9154